MANPNRGAVAVREGDDEWTFSFSVNALCELEDHLDKPVTQIVKSLGDPDNLRISDVRALVWAALLDHHDGITLREAGDVASKIGTIACLEKVGTALDLAFPTKRTKNPRRAKG